MAATPHGAVLIYEVDPDSLPDGVTVEMQQLAGAIDRRSQRGFGEACPCPRTGRSADRSGPDPPG